MTLRGHSQRAMSPAPSGRRVRFVLALALAVAALHGVPGQAAAPKPTVVRAKSSASVDVTLTRPVTLDSEQVKISGGRNFVGFYLHPLGATYKNGTGVVYFHAYREPRFQWHALPLGYSDFEVAPPRTVPAGRYRVYVLGDAPVEVRLPLTGYAGRTLQATRPAKVAFVSKNVTRDVLPAGPAGVAAPGAVKIDLPIKVVSNNTISFTTSQLITRGSFRTATNSTPSCIGAADHPACVTEEKEGNGGLHSRGEFIFDSSPANLGIFLHNYGRYYFPGQITGGDQTAHFILAATNSIDRAIVAAMSIGL